MPTRGQLFGRVRFTAFFLILSLGAVIVLHACQQSSSDEIRPAGASFFPMSVGNMWVFEASRSVNGVSTTATRDTLRIDGSVQVDGQTFYRLSWTSWAGVETETWISRDGRGNIHWSSGPDAPVNRFLIFSANVGETWATGRGGCLDSLRMFDDYSVVETPYGRFDGVHEIGDVSHCADYGWGVSAARGVGPIRWTQITIAGLTEWVLVEARIQDDLVPFAIAEKPRITNHAD